MTKYKLSLKAEKSIYMIKYINKNIQLEQTQKTNTSFMIKVFNNKFKVTACLIKSSMRPQQMSY